MSSWSRRLVVVALVAFGATACAPEAPPPSGVIARAQAEAAAASMIGGGTGEVIASRLVTGADLPEPVVAADVLVWAVEVRNPTPGSCPSAAPGVDGYGFTDPPCPAVATAVIYLHAVTGAYVGVDYHGALQP